MIEKCQKSIVRKPFLFEQIYIYLYLTKYDENIRKMVNYLAEL